MDRLSSKGTYSAVRKTLADHLLAFDDVKRAAIHPYLSENLQYVLHFPGFWRPSDHE
jgi:hypothetical protein